MSANHTPMIYGKKQDQRAIGRAVFEVFYSLSTKWPTGAYPLNSGYTFQLSTVGSEFLPFQREFLQQWQAGEIRVVTLDIYNSELAAYGQCAAFATDAISYANSSAMTFIKLPTITSYLRGYRQTSDLSRSGKSMLPNISGKITTFPGMAEGAYASNTVSDMKYLASANVTAVQKSAIDAELRLTGYGIDLGAEVQPPHACLALYIQVFNVDYQSVGGEDHTTCDQKITALRDDVETEYLKTCELEEVGIYPHAVYAHMLTDEQGKITNCNQLIKNGKWMVPNTILNAPTSTPADAPLHKLIDLTAEGMVTVTSTLNDTYFIVDQEFVVNDGYKGLNAPTSDQINTSEVKMYTYRRRGILDRTKMADDTSYPFYNEDGYSDCWESAAFTWSAWTLDLRKELELTGNYPEAVTGPTGTAAAPIDLDNYTKTGNTAFDLSSINSASHRPGDINSGTHAFLNVVANTISEEIPGQHDRGNKVCKQTLLSSDGMWYRFGYSSGGTVQAWSFTDWENLQGLRTYRFDFSTLLWSNYTDPVADSGRPTPLYYIKVITVNTLINHVFKKNTDGSFTCVDDSVEMHIVDQGILLVATEKFDGYLITFGKQEPVTFKWTLLTNYKHYDQNDAGEVVYDAYALGCAGILSNPANVTDITIPAYAEYEHSDGSKRTYPVRLINAYAFSGNPALVKVTLSEGIEQIGSSAFRACSSLRQVVFPKSMRALMACFQTTSSYVKETLPEGVVELGYSYLWSRNLEEWNLPSSLKIIPSVYLTNPATKITANGRYVRMEDGVLFGYAYKTNVVNGKKVETDIVASKTLLCYPWNRDNGSDVYTLPSDTTAITNAAFIMQGATAQFKLMTSGTRPTKIVINDGCKAIDTSAFGLWGAAAGGQSDYPGVTTLVMPSSVTTVADSPFSSAVSLRHMLNSSTIFKVVSPSGAVISATDATTELGAIYKLIDTAERVLAYVNPNAAFENGIFHPADTVTKFANALISNTITEFQFPRDLASCDAYHSISGFRNMTTVDVNGNLLTTCNGTTGGLDHTGLLLPAKCEKFTKTRTGEAGVDKYFVADDVLYTSIDYDYYVADATGTLMNGFYVSATISVGGTSIAAYVYAATKTAAVSATQCCAFCKTTIKIDGIDTVMYRFFKTTNGGTSWTETAVLKPSAVSTENDSELPESVLIRSSYNRDCILLIGQKRGAMLVGWPPTKKIPETGVPTVVNGKSVVGFGNTAFANLRKASLPTNGILDLSAHAVTRLLSLVLYNRDTDIKYQHIHLPTSLKMINALHNDGVIPGGVITIPAGVLSIQNLDLRGVDKVKFLNRGDFDYSTIVEYIDKNPIIEGYAGSAAEAFARSYNFEFQALTD